jgi:hypothetical protein
MKGHTPSDDHHRGDFEKTPKNHRVSCSSTHQPTMFQFMKKN